MNWTNYLCTYFGLCIVAVVAAHVTNTTVDYWWEGVVGIVGLSLIAAGVTSKP